jgi:prolyl-tRNA synthetase
MRASRYLATTLRDIPKEAEIASHRLMLRAGMIQKIASGLYGWLPMGLRVLNKVASIIRHEHEKAGVLEALAPTLQPASLWRESGRYDDYGQEMLRLKDRHERELLYGPTAEEIFTLFFRSHAKSYKNLPQLLYNIQWKFRDEIRPRFGVMRAREFLMKDAYSFDLTAEGARDSYRLFFDLYLRIFARMGLSAIPLRANTGPIGGDLSHEFHILASTGESQLYYDAVLEEKKCTSMQDFHGIYAAADEQHIPAACPVPSERLKVSRGIEVGHIFYFGTKYSIPLQATVTTHSGEKVPVEMGSYGIGVSRLVGAIIEAFHDEHGIKWPLSVAPYTFVIANIGSHSQTSETAEHIYHGLIDRGFDTFYYDLPHTAGECFADMDLMGFPYQIVIGNQWVHSQVLEVKERMTGHRFTFSMDEFLSWTSSLKMRHGSLNTSV